MGEKQEEFSLEENFARLEKTIERLSSDELPLEEAFRSYRYGHPEAVQRPD